MSIPFLRLERRKFKRAKVRFIVMCRVNSPLSVRIIVGHKEINAISLNLSEGGMAILTNYGIPTSSLITVEFIALNDNAFRDQDRSRSMEVQTQVRYNFLTKERAYRLGVSFIDISEDDRRFIADFVRMGSIRYENAKIA